MSKRKGPRGPLRFDGDCPHTREVIDWAEERKLPVWRPGPHCLKIGPLNYYPTKRAFNSDHAVATKVKGYEQFQHVALRWWELEQQKLNSLWD